MNNGVCAQVGRTSSICVCSNNYTGSLCEYENPCSSQPCQNGAICSLAGVNSQNILYRCICRRGFAGNNCQFNETQVCTSSTCLNGGSCFIELSTGLAKCSCQSQFSGIYCETALNPCLKDDQKTSICLNSGNCIININSPKNYQCICESGFSGLNCEIINSNVCEDKLESCQTWANLGLCDRLNDLNPDLCKKSCNKC